MTNKSDAKLIGEERLAAKLGVYSKDMTEALAKQMLKFGGEIMAQSVEIVPKDFGELAARSFVEGPLTDGNEYFVIIGYEKHGAPTGSKNGDAKGNFYAVPVHERLNARHKPGTQAKYLEQPFKEMAARFPHEMAEAARKVRA